MHHCPRCEAKARIIEVRRLTTGGRRRRLECQNPSCGYRWTIREKASEPLPPGLPKPHRNSSGNRLDIELTDDKLLLILERRDLNNVQLGKLLGCSRELIRQIRLGLAHAGRLPHVPRWSRTRPGRQRSCEQCGQWLGYCSLGHPDPEEEGPEFAAECLDFLARVDAD